MKVRGRTGTNKTRTGRLLKIQRRTEAQEREHFQRRPPQAQTRNLARAKRRIRQIFREMADDAIKRGLTDELLALAYIRAGRKLH
jgi:hypothetical protein